MESKLDRLSLDPPHSHGKETSTRVSTKTPVVDSWDDESLSSSDTEAESSTTTAKDKPIPNAPPPTPITASASPTWETRPDSSVASARFPLTSTLDRRAAQERKRPEKSTAVAGRLIAGALGVKPPKKTEAQRAYERAIKEQEIKRKNREKAETEKGREEEEKAKSDVWDA